MQISDETIIEEFFDRDEKAISDMNDKYGNLCRCISYNILHNDADTEECVNSAYMNVWNAIPPTRPKSLKAYLCEVVRNAAFAIFRANKNYSETQIYFLELADLLPDEAGPEAELESRTLIAYVNQFLETRKALNRKVFVLRYYYNLSVKDIALRLGIKEATVKTKLFRTREELKKFLLGKGYNV